MSRVSAANPWRASTLACFGDARRRHLQHRAQLFGEAGGDGIRRRPQIDGQSAMAGKGHFQHGDQHAAVRAVMIGEQQAAILQFAQRGKQTRAAASGCRDPPARRRSSCVPAPSSCRPADSCPRPSRSAAGAMACVRSSCGVSVARASCTGANAEMISDTGATTECSPAVVLPRGPHGQRVLADRNGDAQRGAQLHADRAHRGVQIGVLARLAAGGHPIRGQADVGEARGYPPREYW